MPITVHGICECSFTICTRVDERLLSDFDSFGCALHVQENAVIMCLGVNLEIVGVRDGN